MQQPDGGNIPRSCPYHNLMHPQTTTDSRTAQNSSRRASSPAGERSSTSASNGGRWVPGAPAGRISTVKRRTDSVGQNRLARRSTTRSANGRPCASVEREKRAWARMGKYCCERERDMGRIGLGRENVLVGVRGRKTSSKDSRRGLARTRRAPLVQRDTSPWEGTMRSVRVRSWAKGRMHRANVSWRVHVSFFFFKGRKRERCIYNCERRTTGNCEVEMA